jgi:DNA repair exonuclease SbcCD nuclease subunit
MTRVIHTGDTHLGYRQYHSPERREDFLAAFRRVVDDAATDADAVVHAGDLFQDRTPGLPDLLGTLDVLRDLRDAGVPFLAVVGNHESVAGDGPQWLDLFETLGLATRLDRSGTTVGTVTLYGLDYVPQSRREDLDYEFAPPETEHAALVAHGLFEPFAGADWDTERLLSAATVEFDAVLLGDNHDPGRTEVAGTPVTYCGSTERASADERDPRGYNIATFEDGSATVSRRGIETREFVFVDVELAPGEGGERVRERVREEHVEDAVVVVTVDGDGDELVPAEIEAFGDEQGALLTRVNDRRELATDRDGADVSFADPDRAVRERVRELGLSDAARSVEETVRGGVADSNVRETVGERVREFVDDPGAFQRAADDGGDTGEGAPDDDHEQGDGQATMEEYL